MSKVRCQSSFSFGRVGSGKSVVGVMICALLSDTSYRVSLSSSGEGKVRFGIWKSTAGIELVSSRVEK